MKEKSDALDGLLEIDLGSLPRDIVYDYSDFRGAVLETAPRLWHRTSLFDQDPLVDRARNSLARKARESRQERTMEQERSADQEAMSKQREQLRRQYSRHLTNALRMINKAEQEKMIRILRERSIPDIESMKQYLPYEFAKLGSPFGTDIDVPEEWIVKAHRSVWQTKVLWKFIQGRPVESLISVEEVDTFLYKQFGVMQWMAELHALRKECMSKQYNCTSASLGIWLAIAEENAAIVLPEQVALGFFRKLSCCPYSFVREVEAGVCFQILENDLIAAYLEHHEPS